MKRTRLRPVSKKRQALNRLRRRVLHDTFGSHPQCRFPNCTALAWDAHELLSRARGGSITDPANIVPLCRVHHDWVTVNPSKAETLGLSRTAKG